MKRLTFKFLLPLLLLVVACNPSYRAQKVEYHTYRITKEQPKDAETEAVMKPYRDSIWRQMEEVIGVMEANADKGMPSSSLGNLMADALRIRGSEKFGVTIDAAFVNYGGVRLNQLPAGNVTRGKVFELMPFENILVLQRVKGDALLQFLDMIASRGGWPVSGLTMEIRDKKAVNVMIGGKPLDVNATYVIANSDYVANGGDDAPMLRVLPQQTIGYLVRDAIIEYMASFTRNGKKIPSPSDMRIKNAQ